MSSRDTHDDSNDVLGEGTPEEQSDATPDAAADAVAGGTGAGGGAANGVSAASGIAAGIIPAEVTADYQNEAAKIALDALMATPDYERLSAFFTAISSDYLVVDVSGSKHKKKGTRVRTVRSTKGQLILPVFTSMAELRAAVPVAQRETVKGQSCLR